MKVLILEANYGLKKQQIYLKVIMNAKYNEEVICGWANQNEFNEDAIRLTNILKQKSTVQALPQLKYMNHKVETDHRKQPIHLKLPINGKLQRQSHQNFKIKREKTQGYEEQDGALPNFKNEKILNVIRLEEQQRLTLSPEMTDYKLQDRPQRYSNLSQFNPPSNNFVNHLKNKQQQTSTFFHTYKSKMTNIKSHQFLPHALDKSQSPKKSQSKHYMKLSTLDMVNNLRKQFRNDLLQRFDTKPCMSEQREYKAGRNSEKLLRNVHIHQKINEKFKQTFFKQDIFNKNRRRGQRTDKGQGKYDYIDQIISSQHSIVVDKHLLQSKMQAIRSPQKGRLIFK